MRGLRLSVLISATMLMGLASEAMADGLPGTRLFATGDPIWVSFVGSEAYYDSNVYFFYEVGGERNYLFSNHWTYPGTTVQLPEYGTGDEVVFGIYVRNTGYTYYTGDGDRNPDGLVHASTDELYDSSVLVGFEDIYGGGDHDYNDVMFKVKGVTAQVVPEPVTMILLGSGLAGVGGAAALRRRRQDGLLTEEE